MGLAWYPIMALATALLGQQQAGTQTFQQTYPSFLERMAADPSAPPGFAVVVVQDGKTVYAKAFGARDVSTGTKLTLDDPMYTASVTKSYVGLLAAQLDAQGKLPLGTSLKDVWPALTLPAPGDPKRVTAAALLSHSAGIDGGGLGWRYGSTGEYRSADVPGHLAEFGTSTNRSFEYSNLGPVIYTAMAEQRTGLDWREQLRSYVFKPLKLNRTSATLEDLPISEVARCHARSGGNWRPVLKPTPILNAGGGIYTSANDAGTFLAAFTSRGRTTGGAFSQAVLAKTYEKVSERQQDFFGFKRWGYGLGWDLSTYGGRQVVSRSGGYAGCRSTIAFLPESGFGVLIFSSADVGANLFNSMVIQQAIDDWTKDPSAASDASARLNRFSAEASKALAAADKAVLPQWGPPESGGADYVGWYENKRLGRMAVALHPDGLLATAGILTLRLSPTGRDAFQAVDPATYEGPEPFTFKRDRSGRPASFIFDDDEYVRVDR